jgi:hypothetical protein
MRRGTVASTGVVGGSEEKRTLRDGRMGAVTVVGLGGGACAGAGETMGPGLDGGMAAGEAEESGGEAAPWPWMRSMRSARAVA